MGLSEREQQLLDEMERSLYQSEADVMQASAARARLNMRSLVLGIVVVLAGIGALIAGVAMPLWWVGLLGFAVMIGGVLLASSKREAIDAAPGLGAASPQAKTTSAKESFADRMERRWDQRMDGER